MLAIDSSCTHLWEPGMHVHTRNALRAGATKAEILEVLELTSVLGLQSIEVGVPLLKQVLEEKGQGQALRSAAISNGNGSSAHQQLQASLQNRKDGDGGFWAATSEALLALSPAFLEAGTEFTSVPYQREKQQLDPLTKELIYIAIDCATTYIRQAALKTHIRNALDLGGTPEQITAVFELASLQGIHTVIKGAELLGDSN